MSKLRIINPVRRRSSLLLTPLLALSLLTVPGRAAETTPGELITPAPSLIELQRTQYEAATEALKKGRLTAFRKYLDNLSGYPLVPYLEYRELERRLRQLPHEDVNKFLTHHKGSYLGDLLTEQWLETLAERRQWGDYRDAFEQHAPNTRDTELRCYYLRARLKAGDETALDEVAPLWTVGDSQPEVCDPLFATWMDAGGLTPAIAWKRLGKAIDNRERHLARYIAKLMPADKQQLAELYLAVDRRPQKLDDHRQFSAQSPEVHEIILHGIRRYARRAPLDALYHWERYDASHYFPDADRTRTQEYLISRLARHEHFDAAEALLAKTPAASSRHLVESMVRDALRNQDWRRVYESLALLPEDEQQSERWLYWRARSMAQLGIEDPDYPTPEKLYNSLAMTRTFYGFMASDILDQDYSLVDQPVESSAELVKDLADQPALQRAKELLEVGSLQNARREWYYGTKDLDAEKILAAGKLAEEWGWYRKSIQAMIEAQHWNDLELRFPLAYKQEMEQAAGSTDIATTFLMAIARQESAFAADARSPAGAMGLMQLMPATAKQTARKMGKTYRYWDLIDPQHNIQLGSSYLDELLERFNGNRVLAAAAYNAGPYRVQQWLKDTDQTLPYDVWIETIPYHETRGYVQNVLAFSVIYGYRMGEQTSLLSETEQQPVVSFSQSPAPKEAAAN